MGKICTDIEQSRKLLEMGIDPGTADMNWFDVPGKPVLEVGRMKLLCDVPAWSLQAILDLLPKRLQFENEQYYLQIEYKTICISYTNIKDDELLLNYSLLRIADEPLIDAAFDMLVWLIDQGYVKTR